MSGPKDYSPPPKYSMNVFNGQLNEVFLLQSQIKSQIIGIQKLLVSNNQLDIHFDCKVDLKKIESQLNQLLKPLIFNYKGTFNQATYNTIDTEISERVRLLNSQKQNLDKIERDFYEKENDYNNYLEYIKYNKNSELSFEYFKQNICDYYNNEIKEVDDQIVKDTISKIGNVKYSKANDKFQFGFTEFFDEKKKEIIGYTKKKESEVNSIRTKTSDAIIKELGSISFKAKMPENIVKLQDNIALLIDSCNDIDCRKKYQTKLKALSDSESLKDEYYFKELIDSIYLAEKNRKNKIELTAILLDINQSQFHHKLILKKTALTKKISDSLNLNKIKDSAVSTIKKDIESLKTKNKKLIEDEGILERERLFLKSQMITTLSNMGYEVMDDLEVIDFEKSDDYLLKVKGQENYINVMFREDGSMKYNFQIPEKKENLSVDEKKMKLQEMKLTCNDFNSAVGDLRKMGLNLKLNREEPIAEKTLLSFTKKTKERLKDKLKSKQPSTKQQETKKRYLNN
ncbi:hypothetical protein BFP78_00105 [Gaetbulibacter sp. 5U11]|nr:hypothetical protein BFP78_00105 [Gaetbulibacter sp. 5U11]